MSGPSRDTAVPDVCMAVLALAPDSGPEDIRLAYRRLAMRYHPDASGDPDTARRFSCVVRAYKVLRARESSQPGPRPALAEKYGRVLEAGDDIFALGRVFASEPEDGARAAAVARLGFSGRTAAYVFLRRAFYDRSEEVRLAAVRASALLGARQAAGELAALFTRSDSAFRRAMLDIAAATGEPLFRETVAAARGDAEPAVRHAAERLWSKAGY